MRNDFIRKLLGRAKDDSKIILLTGDLGFGLFDNFERELPDQYLNVGISEQNMIGIAAGLAIDGFKVFCYSIGNFSFMRCLEQIRNDVCYHNLDVNIISSGPGFSYGALGFTHHATEDISIMRAIPNVSVLSPATENEADQALNKMLNFDNPAYCRLDKTYANMHECEVSKEYEWGTLIGNESDIMIVTTGVVLSEVAAALRTLMDSHSITACALSISSLTEFVDAKLIELFRNKKTLFTVEEHVLNGGLGSIVSELLMDWDFRGLRVIRIGIPNEFAKVVGSQAYLRSKFGFSADDIVAQIISMVHDE